MRFRQLAIWNVQKGIKKVWKCQKIIKCMIEIKSFFSMACHHTSEMFQFTIGYMGSLSVI
jgi:hypothetical protein